MPPTNSFFFVFWALARLSLAAEASQSLLATLEERELQFAQVNPECHEQPTCCNRYNYNANNCPREVERNCCYFIHRYDYKCWVLVSRERLYYFKDGNTNDERYVETWRPCFNIKFEDGCYDAFGFRSNVCHSTFDAGGVHYLVDCRERGERNCPRYPIPPPAPVPPPPPPPLCGGRVCASGKRCCSNQCVSTTIDENNCGRCGNRCGAGRFCDAGRCFGKTDDKPMH